MNDILLRFDDILILYYVFHLRTIILNIIINKAIEVIDKSCCFEERITIITSNLVSTREDGDHSVDITKSIHLFMQTRFCISLKAMNIHQFL